MKTRFFIILLSVVLLSPHTAAQKTARKARLKVGLVLGGGGAKGAAEIGVLKVLEQTGIPIDYIAGTSIGSIVGGLYSLGYRSAELDTLFRSQQWTNLFKKEITKGRGILQLLDSLTNVGDSINFNEMPIPFRCVAVDVNEMQEVVLDRGSLPLCMRASMAIPGAFKAVRINGRKLVDGGVLNNLPVDVVREMGADVVIAVDLQQNKHKTRDFSLREVFGIGGILDWLISRPDWRKYNDNRADADIHINPDLDDFDVMSFSAASIADMIVIGEQAATQQLGELKTLKKRIYRR